MNATSHRYIHALGPAVLTRFYDPVFRLLTREDTFRGRMVEHAQLAPGQRMLDVGCGTGTFALRAQQRQPGVEVHAIDGDDEVLAIARDKAARAGAGVRFERAMAWSLPYPDGTFDRVTSSLMFHHLALDDKRRAAREILRVLRPGGALLLADFVAPGGAPGRAFVWVLRRFEHLADNLADRLPAELTGAGFSGVAEIDRHPTALMPIAFLRGYKPGIS
ncbi:SAM-dependent methyltransferase [Sorangium cellulosum]|uniref:SAM-dependent methyltransferase n=1 Tax=Sorangium cellulosum TaxID=56 RepID=A0A2L0EKM9_SORCE|nr:class I SAM-dependent methyltransferase [Sorangium cellulosum]AUX39842.1 SAM-dependent methyltransferase [Sorangium cellulosum]